MKNTLKAKQRIKCHSILAENIRQTRSISYISEYYVTGSTYIGSTRVDDRNVYLIKRSHLIRVKNLKKEY
jgi:hypothetical protein